MGGTSRLHTMHLESNLDWLDNKHIDDFVELQIQLRDEEHA